MLNQLTFHVCITFYVNLTPPNDTYFLRFGITDDEYFQFYMAAAYVTLLNNS